MWRRVRYLLAALAVLVIVGGVFLAYYVKTLGPRLKGRVVTALEDRFDADVTLAGLQFSFFPLARVDGEGLTISHKQWSGEQPLIKIQRFHAETDYTTILDWRNRVNKVVLEGLEIRVPSRGRAALKSGVEANQPVSSDEPGHDTTRLKFVIETIIADHALVEIEPKEAGKDPLQFPIEKLTMHSVGLSQAMTFKARLTNAKPPGSIDSSGHFGPWQRDDPRATPVSGDYIFRNANLAVFNGITGTLSSEGQYRGILQHINVDGTTDTPNFDLTEGGVPVHLTTRFHSVVDGTNGDTILDPVDAKFGHSEFICSGGVVQQKGERGKTVQLDARTKYGRMEDILKLVVNGSPIVTGNVEFQSKIVIPPGKQQVIDKLGLDGHFHLTSAVFTSDQAAERLRILSDRASGVSKSEEKRGEGERGKVASDLFGKFRLNNNVISFATLSFRVPGARIQLAGKYNLKSSQVDMNGKFEMQATLSETQSGIKALLLKPLDRFFKKDGAGFEVPLSITGDREHPTIGVSAFHKTFAIH
jgi:hypothetical protein